MALEEEKRAIVAFIKGRSPDFTALAEELYRQPETGLCEVASSALLAAFLEREGFAVERGCAGLATAFRATWGSGGPVVALLAEMDALPQLGHACGHNIIAAAAVGAATALRHQLPDAAGRIVVLGTPAEELGIGKVELIRHGLFADVDFALMVHPSSRRQVIKEFLGLARLRFTFSGKAAHAGVYPEEGINALDGVIQTFNGINALRQQLRQDVRVHGIITDGGSAANIVPERAACYFHVRAADLAMLEQVKARVIACAEGAATASGCRLEVEVDPRQLAPMKINRAFAALYSAQLSWLGLPEVVATGGTRGSSDIGNVSQLVPTIHPHVPIGDGLRIHTGEFARATVAPQGQAAVVEGATTLALTVLELLDSPERQAAIREEFSS